jgi:hypothetical protein
MKPVLRSCPHCHLVFEGEGACPACHVDPASLPPAKSEPHERRKTGQVPVIPKKPPNI